MIFWRSWAMTDAVTAMIGMRQVSGSARSCWNATIPLIPGNWMSIKTSAGCCSRAIRTPSSPVPASIVWYLFTCRVSRTSFRFLGLSSTIRISSFATAHRDRERERRALPHLTLDQDPSAMKFDELPRQGQAKPGAFDFLGRRSDLFELFED